MITTFVNGACVLIEANDKKIICDPWFVGEAYYGSWSIYPPLKINPKMLNDLDYVYISHIHPDHLHEESLEKSNKDVPVIIHSFEEKFLKDKLERLGRKVIELKHGDHFNCGNDVNIHIYAADNCDVKNSTDFLGLGKNTASENQSTGIETICIIEDGNSTIMNVNDCPYDLTIDAVNVIIKKFGSPDLLLFPYNAAGSFPQCFANYSEEEKYKQSIFKERKFLDMGLKYLKTCMPKYYLPFAGGYTLCGKLTNLNKFRGNPDNNQALKFYQQRYQEGEGIILNQLASFDLKTKEISENFKPINIESRERYCREILRFKKYDYEEDEMPSLQNILDLIPRSYERFNKKRKELNFSTDKNIYIYLPENKMVKINSDENGYEIIKESDLKDRKYVSYRLDFRLLYRILMGPKYAHWDNATVGSHVEFYRTPDVYEKKIHWCMNYFHS